MTSPSNRDLMTKVVHGGAWVYGRVLFSGAMHLGVMAILARQLTPAQFGIVALAQVVLRLLVVLGAEGVNEYVIYDNKEGRERRVQAAFWMDLSFSAAGALLGLVFVPLITRFYAEPGLGPILVAMLLRCPVDALSKVPDALLKKDLNFRALAVRDTVLDVGSSVFSVVLALRGHGVWSLVIPGLVASPLRALAVFHAARWRPGLAFHFQEWPRIFSYSSKVIGSTLTTLVVNEGDTLLIGKLLGSQALGIYNLAWTNANMVSRNVSGVVNKLAMPALSAVSDDIERLRFGLSRMQRVLSIVAFPLLVGLFVVADDFVLTIYGPQWEEAILPLRILIVFALRYAVGSPAGAVFKAVGRPDINLLLGMAIVPVYLAAIWAGSSRGIVGVAVAVTLVRTVFGFVSFELVGRCLGQGFSKVVRPLLPAFAASLCMGGVMYLTEVLLSPLLHRGGMANLIVLVAVGATTYMVLLRTVFRHLAEDIARVAGPLLGPFHVVVVRLFGIGPREERGLPG